MNNKHTREELIELVTKELQRLIAISMHYDTLIQESTTTTKRKYYTKRLRKNNELVSAMLIRLESMRGSFADDGYTNESDN